MVGARVVRQTKVVLSVSHLGVSIRFEFCSWLLPVLGVGESPAIWSATGAAPTARDRSLKETLVSDLAFHGTTDTALPPLNTRPPTPDRPHLTW